MLPAGLAWACVGVVSLTTAAPTVQPGGTLTITGKEFAQAVPIQIRLDSPAGRLLTTVPAPETTMNSSWTVTLTVPSDVPNGRHFLVATQDHHNMNSGAPARSIFYVGQEPPPGPGPGPRPAALAVDSGPSVGPPALHGPYIQWTRTVGGKTVTRYLTGDQLARYQQWFNNARRLKEIVAKLEIASLHAVEQSEAAAAPAAGPSTRGASRRRPPRQRPT